MQKILFRPICHMTNQEANLIYEEIKSTQGYFGQPNVNQVFEKLPQQNILQKGVGGQLPNIQSEAKLSQNNTGNRFISAPQNNQYPSNPSSGNLLNAVSNLPQSQNAPNTKFIMRGSITDNYDDFFNCNIEVDLLKQQNSRLYYQKLALETSVQRLKQQGVKKDNQIAKLKETIQANNRNGQNSRNIGHVFQQGSKNPIIPVQQIHFRSNFQPKRAF